MSTKHFGKLLIKASGYLYWIKIFLMSAIKPVILSLQFDISFIKINKVFIKMKIERDELAKRVNNFYEQFANKDQKVVINHFKSEGFCRETIRIILKRYKEEGKIITSNPSGKKKTKNLKNIEIFICFAITLIALLSSLLICLKNPFLIILV